MLFGKKTFLHTKKCMYSYMPLNPIKWTVTRTVLCYCALYDAYMQSLSTCGLMLNVTQQTTTTTPHQMHLRVSAIHFSAALAACIQCCCKLLLIHCLRRKGSDSLPPVQQLLEAHLTCRKLGMANTSDFTLESQLLAFIAPEKHYY